MAGLCQQAYALATADVYSWTEIPLDTATSITIGDRELSWATEDNGYITINNIDTSAFQFDLIKTSWNLGTAEGLRDDIMYATGVHTDKSTRDWGFYAVGNTQVGGHAHTNSDCYGTTSAEGKITGLIPNGETSVRLQAQISTSGTYLRDEYNLIDIYGSSSLKYADYPTVSLTINPEYVGSVYVKTETAGKRIYNTAKTWGITVTSLDEVFYHNANEKNQTQVPSDKDVIIGGGNPLLYLNPSNADVVLDNNIYMGSSTNAFGTIHANNSSYASTLNGNLYIIENTVLSSRSGNKTVTINGIVTDKNVPGATVTSLGNTLAIKGMGFVFNETVDVTNVTIGKFNHSSGFKTSKGEASFEKGINAETLALADASTVSIKGTSNLGTLILGAGLSAENAAITTSGALTLGNIKLDLTNYAAGSYKLVSATDGGDIIWTEGAWTHADTLADGLIANVGFVGEGNNTLQLTVSEIVNPSADDPTKVLSYTRDGNALTLMVEDPISANATVYVGLLEPGMADEILTGLNGETMVTIALRGSNGVLVNADTIDEVVFVNEKGQGYWGEMVGPDGGEKVLMYNVNRIPEPASATLSLAALMMLCARRRRRA